MKKIILAVVVFVLLGVGYFVIQKKILPSVTEAITITYPYNKSVFPADITAPGIRWIDENKTTKQWQINVFLAEKELLSTVSESPNWRPAEKEWEMIKTQSLGNEITISVGRVGKKSAQNAAISILISEDKVEAPIFFRAVPLPFKFARENLKRIKWHLGSVSEINKPHVVLENIPVCANCHSFTPDGSTLAMDVDARDDKGAYAISAFQKETIFAEDSIIHWSKFQDDKFTYGLLSQISPNGRYVVSTLEDCEIFADRKDMEYSQLFFPFKGILVVYDRETKTYTELEGANDTTFVHSNPIWTPDGKNIYFTKAPAKHFQESGIHNGSVPKPEDNDRYQVFEKQFMDRDSLMKYDIYKIPFVNGKGGKAVPVEGASNNGMSNYFPKISPNGKWLVFCQAKSFMLLQKDSKLTIIPVEGGKARQMNCNTSNMNSWHSWSPNSKWLVFSTKELSPYTQLFLTHINDDGSDSPPIFLEKFAFDNYAVNISEFVNIEYNNQIKINPTFLSENDFLIRNGEIKMKDGNIKGAFLDFDQAVKSFPKESEPYYQRGRVYYEKGQFEKAVDDFNTAIKIEKVATYYTSRGIAYVQLNNIEKAIQDLSAASKLDPTNFTPVSYLGIAHTKLNDYPKAINYLEKAVDLFDGDAYTYYYLGLSHYSLKDWTNANKALTSAIKLNPKKSIKPLVYELRGRSLFNLGDYYGAINDLKITSELSPNDHEPYLLRGQAELKVGLRTEGLKSLNQAKKLGSVNAGLLIRQNS